MMRPHSRIVAIVLAGGLVACIVVARNASTSARSKSSQPRTSDLEWGFYQILWSRDYHQRIGNTIRAIGAQPHYVMFYRDLTLHYPKMAIDAVVAHGATPIVSLELWHWHARHPSGRLAAIADGAYDDQLARWAQAARADNQRVLLRFGFEFNGDWFTWSGSPDLFIKAWRRAHGIFVENQAHNVEWVWSPNVVSCPDTPAHNMHRYYPGRSYVDWVGVDGYNFGDHHDQWHQWSSFEEVFDHTLSDLATRYAGKPMMLAEFGSAPGNSGARANWILEAHETLQRHPAVKAAVWFNYDKRSENEPNWRIDNCPESLQAFRQTFCRSTLLKQ